MTKSDRAQLPRLKTWGHWIKLSNLLWRLELRDRDTKWLVSIFYKCVDWE